MSMPSSRLEVATTAGSRPALSASSISVRSCRDTEPWCARAMITSSTSALAASPGMPPAATNARSAASSLSRPHSRSASRRRVREHDRGPVRLDQVEHPLLDVRPDRPARLGILRRRRPSVQPGAACPTGRACPRRAPRPRARSASRWPAARPSTGREPPRNAATSSGGRTVADSPIRCARRAPARPGAAQRVEPLERQRQVRAPLGPRHGVDLVDDDRLDPAQRLPRLRGEQQEQRLRRGDQDVRRPRRELAPFLGRGVPGAHRHAGCPARAARAAAAACLIPVSGDAQVPLDVHGERLERRHVQHPACAASGRRAAASRRAGRSPTGTRPASCPTRSARRPACRLALADGRARPAPAPAWARRTRPRTTPGSRPRTRRAPPRCSPGRCPQPGPVCCHPPSLPPPTDSPVRGQALPVTRATGKPIAGRGVAGYGRRVGICMVMVRRARLRAVAPGMGLAPAR